MHFKTLKNKKAVSPIIATLLLILIAVAAGVIIYVWATGYIGTQIGTVGGQENFVITNVKYYKIGTNNNVNVTVINQGAIAVNITTVRVYSANYTVLIAYAGSTSSPLKIVIEPASTYTFSQTLTLVTGKQIIRGQSYVLEITTVKGNTAVYRFTA